MDKRIGYRARAAVCSGTALVCTVLVCMGMAFTPCAMADVSERDEEIGREPIAATGVSEDDGIGSGDSANADGNGDDDSRQSLQDDVSPLALWNSPPTRGWMKFLDKDDNEQASKRITVSGQDSYRMPSMDGVPDVDYHAGQGLSGNADWKPIAWQSQWFDVGGKCQWDYTLAQCQITGNGGFEPPVIQGEQTMRRFRPGDTVKAPTASGSNPWWAIYHNSWAMYIEQIRYAPNGGTGSMQSNSANVSAYDLNGDAYAYSMPATVSANGFVRPGYRFTGWKARATGVIWQPGDTCWLSVSNNPTSTYSEYQILDAQWERLPQATSMPSTGGTGMPLSYAIGAGLCGAGCCGIGVASRRFGRRR
ncbi:hypothetical protein [Bifidobacterium aerophilum]|uniref:hypothetical protein n=1 Tax=Bifidobacterium aerophilum TaxID=1798155 RepID=UPI0013D2D7DE|nr:hypothetical protein [Bifidobacterium aerophilum]